jgi:hypothetical protein
MDLTVWGYLAVAQRLLVPEHPTPPSEGVAGKVASPVLMADAPLIALTLARRGYRVGATLSHPGRNSIALAAARFVLDRLTACRLGPNRGTPFHTQVLSNAGQSYWFSDPTNGLNSLNLVAPEADTPRWLYVDAYPWLQGAIEATLEPRFRDGLFVNMGTIDREGLEAAIPQWRRHAGDRLLVVQASTGRADRSPAEVTKLSRLAISHGADYGIVTAGSRGLVVTSREGTCCVAPEYVDCSYGRTDTAGAGAAVSSSVIATLLSDSVALSVLGGRAAEAGRAQCSVAGPVGAELRDEWDAVVRSLPAD